MIRKHVYTALSDNALKIYRDFSSKEGAQHIAKPPSIQAVAELLKLYKPKTILEVGGGIGALSYVCLKYSDAHVDIFEDNEFCINALYENLVGFGEQYSVHTDYNNYSLPYSSYDLIIFDGGTYELIVDLVKVLDDIGIVYFEGNRINDRAVFRKALRDKYIFSVKEYVDGNNKYKGGHEMTCKKIKSPFIRNALYLYWETLYYIKQVAINGLLRRVKRAKNIFVGA